MAVNIVGKEQLARDMAKGAGITVIKATEAFEALCAAIATNLVAGNDVRLQGVGTMKTSVRHETHARNPRTNTPILVPARRMIKFSPSLELKKGVRGESDK